MSEQLSYAWAEPADLAEYEAFIARSFGRNSVQALPGRARWLFWDNPLGLHVALCRRRGELVASCGHLPLPVNQEGSKLLAGFGIDMMVLPECRRRGIGKGFLRMRLDRFALGLSSGQSEDMAALYKQAGALDLGIFHLARMRRTLPASSRPRHMVRDLSTWLLPRMRRRPRRCCRLPLMLAVAAARLADATSYSYLSRQGKVWADWFVWRYGGAVYEDYRCWEIRASNAAPGILVTRSEPACERIVDLFADHCDRARLLAAAAWTSPAPEVAVLGVGGSVLGDLESAGYLVRPQKAHLVGQTASSGALDSASLEFLAGASDADLMRRPLRSH